MPHLFLPGLAKPPFQDKTEFHVLTPVNADGDELTGSLPSVHNLRYEIPHCSCPLPELHCRPIHRSSSVTGPFVALSVTSTQDLTTLSDIANARELQHFPPDGVGTRQNGRVLWRSPRKTSLEPHLTAILPLELNSIILGYCRTFISKISFGY